MDGRAGVIAANWQHFLASILFAVLFPLLPLGIEATLGDELTDKSILISSIMYCTALALASSSVWVLGLGFVSSLILAVCFGITFYNGEMAPPYANIVALICIGFFAASHILERYVAHVVRAKNFIDFRRAS